jgi:hypothetical protein
MPSLWRLFPSKMKLLVRGRHNLGNSPWAGIALPGGNISITFETFPSPGSIPEEVAERGFDKVHSPQKLVLKLAV